MAQRKAPVVVCTGRQYAESHAAKPWVFTFRIVSRGRGTFSMYRNAPDAFTPGNHYRLGTTEIIDYKEPRRQGQGQ